MRRPVPLPRCPCEEPLQRDQVKRWSLKSNDRAVVRCVSCNALLQLHVREQRVAGLGTITQFLAVEVLSDE